MTQHRSGHNYDFKNVRILKTRYKSRLLLEKNNIEKDTNAINSYQWQLEQHLQNIIYT